MSETVTESVSRMRLVGTVATCLLLAAGCSTPLNHVGAFSKASADIAKRAADAYAEVNEITVDRKIVDIAADPKRHFDKQTFEVLVSPSNLAVRVSLLKGVEKYAEALGELASADFRKDIDAAAKGLYGAIGELQSTYTSATGNSLPLSTENLAIIATAVDAIGTTIAENRRRSALRAVVTEADPALQKALAIVGSELPGFHDLVLGSVNTIETEMIKAYENEATNITFDARIERLRAIYAFRQAKAATAQTILDLGTAGRKIAIAHGLLAKTLRDGKFTTPELVEEIKNLVSTAQTFRDFHDALVKGEKK